MSNKKLLSESAVRSFMKLANMGSLTDNFIRETYGDEGMKEGHGGMYEEEEAMEEMAHGMEEMAHGMEEDLYEGAHDDGELVDDEPAEEAPEEGMELSADQVAQVEAALTDALQDFASSVEGSLPGVEMSVTSDDEAPADMGDMDMDAPPMDAADEDEPELPGDMDMVDDEEIMEETYRRVAARLRALNENHKREEKLNSLTEAIYKRLKQRP